MKKIIFNTKFLLPVCLVMMAIGLATSCKKDEVKSTKVELLSFGPTGAMHGDTLRFIGNNLDKVTEIDLTGAIVPATGFISKTPEQILIIVPQATEQGFITLKTPDGNLVTLTKLNLLTPITITSMTKQARPGETISIKGTYLNWVKSVTFAKDLAETTFVSRTFNELVVKVPKNARSGTLFLGTSGTKPLSIETDSTLLVTLPAFTTFTPNPILHETNLTISGTNLDLVKGVIFTGVTAPDTVFVSQSATQIVMKVPAGVSQGKISFLAFSTLIVPSAVDLVVTLPAFGAFSPNPVSRGSNLTITGTNLDLVTGVKFNGVTTYVTTFVSQSATQLIIKVPDTATKGKLTLSVLHSLLTVQSAAILKYVGDPIELDPLAYAIYEDDFANGWQNWGWGSTADAKSSENIRDGVASMKLTYTGWGGLKFAAGSVATAAYNEFTFSIFGAPGTRGMKINVTPKGGAVFVVTIEEGKWVEYIIPKAQMLIPATVTEVLFANEGWLGTVYLDHVGFR